MAQSADSGNKDVTLLRQMLEIESLSGQEQELSAFLVGAMQARGFSRAYVDAAGNAIGEVGEGPRPVVLLGHIDTVPGRVPVRLENGQLYGRGAVDAKGPLAAFISATAQAGPLPGLRLVVVGAVEEEAATSKGTRAIARRFQEEGIPVACVIGEPSGWDRITVGYKGRLLADFMAEQSAGHTAGPRGGVCETAVLWWLAIQAYCNIYNVGKAALFDQLHPSLRRIHSFGDGLVERVEATAGFRVPPECDVADLRATVKEAAKAAGGRVRLYAEEMPYRAEKNTPLARAFLAAIRASGGTPAFKVKTGTSDMNVVGPAWGCPIVAYGAGDSSLDHTPDEHIVIEEYLRSIAVLAHALRGLADEKP
ncbi:MAG: [LysW]-lysine hydrolase [Anaerolineae bacterium]|nr:[LysW]-lysine hydrolase [Anaerolineae bacterium]